MNSGKTVFAQLLEHFPYYEFSKCVDRYQGEYKVKTFSCFSQFLAMAFAQMTQRESLRDIETCLRAMQSRLYHIGFRGTVSRNTLANANSQRDWHMYADFALCLIDTARRLYADDDFGVQLKKMVYALDSTTIDLCLSLFPWAQFRKHKAAVKMHTLLDLHGNIPSFVWITSGAVHDVTILDTLPVEAGAFYLLDRGYLDFFRLHRINREQAFFITRTKSNFQFRRMYSAPVKKKFGILCDQTVELTGRYSLQRYPDKLRRIRYHDAATGMQLTFLTNNFCLAATTIAKLFRHRWQIELFFRWIKQHLHIKAFYGTTANAVKTQIWIAIATYVLVAIVKKRLNIEMSLYNVLQILSITLFEKAPLLQVLSEENVGIDKEQTCNQLNLFN